MFSLPCAFAASIDEAGMIVESGPLGCGSSILLNLMGFNLKELSQKVCSYFVSMNDYWQRINHKLLQLISYTLIISRIKIFEVCPKSKKTANFLSLKF